MGKIFANDATDKGLICKTHKYLLQLNIKKTKIEEGPILWPPDMNSQLIGKDPNAGKTEQLHVKE